MGLTHPMPHLRMRNIPGETAMTFPMSRTSRFAVVALLGAALAGCSGDPPPARGATDEPGPAPAATVAAAARGDAGATSSKPMPATKRVRGEWIARQERPDDYYPEEAKPQEPAFVRDMQQPYTDLGPTESRFFDGKFVDGAVTDRVMRRRDFDSTVLELQNEGGADALARQQAYVVALQKSLQPYANIARLGRVGCGAVMCMGSLQTPRTDWISQWSVDLHKQPLPMPSLSLSRVKLAPDLYEVRFAFTTRGHGGFRVGER